MVCAKCQKLVKQTQLATPEVKKKNEMYFGSPASGSGASTKSTSGLKGAGVTLGSTGVSKSKLLSKGAKNPYAAYSSSCDDCRTKVEAGNKFCHRCAFKKNACARCGKGLTATQGGSSKAPLVQGQKFSAK